MGLKGYEGFITSISYNLEERQNTELTIATYNTKFEDIFQKLTATMTDISYNENKINTAANSFESNGTIKANVFQKSLEDNFERVSLGTNNDIIINQENGITLKDRNTTNAVKLIGNGIFLTDNIEADNVEWKTGLTGEGINAAAITVGNIDTKQVNIWNASEDQIRFRWNEQGLFAYGDGLDLDINQGISTLTATSTDLDKIIDYNKFVKFNQDGLEFSDNGKSALSLGWTGLKINTQNNSLILDADNGLTLTEWNGNNGTNRLQLGKLDNGNIYGLKLKNTSGSTSFQSDSDGNLWLSKFINIGGNFDDSRENATYKPTEVNAGIIGISTNESLPKYQMGVMRDPQTGEVIFKTTELRFWAGPQSPTDYLTNLSLTTSDVEQLPGWNSLTTGDPALAKFKVDSEGNIIASGIDVGGWIGAGKILRSKDYEAILRSGEYEKVDLNGITTALPVFSIGNNTTTSIDGTDYHFRVYQDGTLKIGNDQFIVYPNGAVIAQNITIDSTSSSMIGGFIGGWQISNQGIEKISGDYKTGIYPIANSNSYAIQVGVSTNPEFTVDGKGQVKASNIEITGRDNTSPWIINSTELQISKTGQIGAGIIPNQNPDSFDYNNYDFSVANGDIRFKGNISANYENNWYTGVNQDIITVTIGNVTTNYRVVKGLIVGRSYSN